MFEETLKFQKIIFFITRDKLISQMPRHQMWHISQIINYISPIVTTCVLNKSHGHWFSINALHFAISMNLKPRGKLNCALFDSSMERDSYVFLLSWFC